MVIKMKEFKWVAPYITLDVEPVTILPPSPEQIRVTEQVRNIERVKHYRNLLAELNLPVGSGVNRVGKLAPNDDFHLTERHYWNTVKGLNDE